MNANSNWSYKSGEVFLYLIIKCFVRCSMYDISVDKTAKIFNVKGHIVNLIS